jgi:hypothetical protein
VLGELGIGSEGESGFGQANSGYQDLLQENY